MANVRAIADGTVRQFFSSFSDTHSIDPTATLVVDFDETTNPALVADLAANPSSYFVAIFSGSPQLQKNGVAITITAPSALYSLQSTILNGVSDATLKAAVVALWNGTATAQQQQRALAYCLLKLHEAGTI